MFDKGYNPNFTDEIFYIDAIKNTNPITYGIRDFNGEKIQGSFYEAEIVPVNKSSDIYPIGEVIKKRKVRNGTEFFVSWRGYPSSANSWVSEKDLLSIRNAS